MGTDSETVAVVVVVVVLVVGAVEAVRCGSCIIKWTKNSGLQAVIGK